VGFETTAPSVAACVEEAGKRGTENFFVLCGHKTMPRAMSMLAEDPELKIDGFICPGHVSAVIGSRPYEFLADNYNIPCVIAGFEPLDIIQSVLMLISQIAEGKSNVEIQYSRAVKPEGNKKAVEILYRVFEPVDSEWRGMGIIPMSGLKIRDEFSGYDAEARLPVEIGKVEEHGGCICGDVLKGKAAPEECKLFRKICSPANPVGACMVSSEGACAASFKYGGGEING
jgi:hydrogenase expression/formation protein HypD